MDFEFVVTVGGRERGGREGERQGKGRRERGEGRERDGERERGRRRERDRERNIHVRMLTCYPISLQLLSLQS